MLQHAMPWAGVTALPVFHNNLQLTASTACSWKTNCRKAVEDDQLVVPLPKPKLHQETHRSELAGTEALVPEQHSRTRPDHCRGISSFENWCRKKPALIIALGPTPVLDSKALPAGRAGGITEDRSRFHAWAS